MSTPLEIWRVILGSGSPATHVFVAVVMAEDSVAAVKCAQGRAEAAECTAFDWRLIGHALPSYAHAAIISMHSAQGL